MNASSRFVRLSLGTDSLRQAEVIMNQVYPFIPLVQNGTISLDEFKRKLQGFREATRQDFDNYLLRALQTNTEEAKRIPQLGQAHKKIHPKSPLSPNDTVEAAQGYADAHLTRMYSGNEQTVKEVLASLHMQKLELKESNLPAADEIAGEIDMSRAMVAQAYRAFYSGDMVHYRQLVTSLQDQLKEAEIKTSPALEDLKQDSVVVTQPTVSSTSITLSKAWDMYIKEKGQKWRKSEANENKRFFDVLFYVIGDKSVDTISKQDIREALK